jgi:hypothetical protein
MFRHALSSALLLLSVLPSAIALAVELPATLTVSGQKLVLNGAGTRKKYFLELYDAGLYLIEPNNQPAAIIDADAPMAIHLVITSKLVSQEKFFASLEEGFKNSTQDKVESIRAEIDQLRQCFADEITRGNVIDLIYTPAHGVVVFKNGKRKGSVPGLAFKRALFGIWLSDRPADAALKQAFLGSANVRRK